MSDSARIFDETSIHEESKVASWEDERLRDTAAFVPEDCRSVLDVGCGRGELLRRLRAPFTVGTDLARRGIRRAGVPVVRSSVLDLPFAAASFDVVISAETLEHLDPEQVAAAAHELCRVARRHVLVTVPWDENLLERSHRCPRCGAVFNIDGHVRSFDEAALRALFPDARGFEVRGSRRVRPWNRALLGLRTSVFGLWKYTQHTMCLACGNQTFENHERRFLWKAFTLLNRLLNPRKSRWRWILLRVDL